MSHAEATPSGEPPVHAGIAALRPYEAGKPLEALARELGVTDAVKLASNENPLGPSPYALSAAARALTQTHFYPDAAAHELRAQLAEFHGVSAAEVVQGAGSNELLTLLYRTFTTRDSHVVFAENAFVVYQLEALAHGVPFTAVPLDDWAHDLPAMAAAVRPETRLLFIANPNNPTGTHVGRAALERLLREVPPQVIVVLDEAYVEYADAEDYVSGLELRALRERLVVLRTFSKAYGLAALRVGYGVFPAALADYVNRVRMPFNVGTVAQAAAVAALADQAHVQRGVELNRAERVRVLESLVALGLSPVRSQTNFVYLPLPPPHHGREVYEALLREGVIVRPMGGAIRVSFGTAAQNDRFLAAFARVLGR